MARSREFTGGPSRLRSESRLPALGDAWPALWEIDPSGLVIKAMKRLGLAWNVVLITPERQDHKMAEVA